MVVQLLRHTFAVEEYHRMAAAGILGEDDRVELLDGEILEVTPMGSRHAACVDRLTHMFVRGVGQRAIVRVQNPGSRQRAVGTAARPAVVAPAA